MVGLLGNIDKLIEGYVNQEAIKSFNAADQVRVDAPEIVASSFSKGKTPASSSNQG